MPADAKDRHPEIHLLSMEDVRSGIADRAPRSFKRLLVEATARFVHLPPDQVDQKVEELLRSVCEFLAIERATVWQILPGTPDRWRLTHLYQHPDHVLIQEGADGSLSPKRGWDILSGPESGAQYLELGASEVWPWTARKLGDREIVVIHSLEDLPKAARKDQLAYLQLGSRSILGYPLQGGEQVIGFLCFGMVSRERAWTSVEVEDLVLISQILGSALERQRTDLELQRNEARLNLAASAAQIALWSIDSRTGRIWINGSGRTIFGLDPKAELTWNRFLAVIHADDRAQLEAAYEAAVRGEEVQVEHRFTRADGCVRWALFRGRLLVDPKGRPDQVMGIAVDISDRKAAELKLKEQMEEIRRLRDHYQAEVSLLREEVQVYNPPAQILGTSPAIQQVRLAVRQVAPLDTTVLVLGATGTGKNLVAAAIHAQSRRRDRPMMVVSCSALPANLIETELFGREAGAYPGADQPLLGRFERADGSTLYLDEIGGMPLDLQAKLLRVLQTGEFERLGSTRTLRVDVRIIASSLPDLEEAVHQGRFRADLFYRLNVFPIVLPALAERREDIPLLVQSLVEQFARRYGRPIEPFSPAVLRRFQDQPWPGNVRELENLVERSIILAVDPVLPAVGSGAVPPAAGSGVVPPAAESGVALPAPGGEQRPPVAQAPSEDVGRSLEEVERRHILAILQSVWWRVEGPGGAAELLGLNPSTLRARLRKLGIRRAGSRP